MQRKSLKQAVPTALFGTHRMAGPVSADQRSMDAAFMPGSPAAASSKSRPLLPSPRPIVARRGRPEVGRAVFPAHEDVLLDDALALPRDPVVVEGRAEAQQRAGRHLGVVGHLAYHELRDVAGRRAGGHEREPVWRHAAA